MSRQTKRKYRKRRAEFKNALFEHFRDNQALAILTIETYTAWQHRRHIMMIWSLFQNPEHAQFKKEYTDKLLGKHLTGSHDIWRSFYFAGCKKLYQYQNKIPEKYAMGDALGVAYEVLKEKESQ